MKVLDTDIIKIVSVTDDGKEVVSELSKKEWMNDWYGGHLICPANNDNVIYASINGIEIPLQFIANISGDGQLPIYFEHVCNFLDFARENTKMHIVNIVNADYDDCIVIAMTPDNVEDKDFEDEIYIYLNQYKTVDTNKLFDYLCREKGWTWEIMVPDVSFQTY